LSQVYNNKSLFSDYYLEELLTGHPHWQALKKVAREHRQRVANILEEAIPGINGDTPEAEVERRLIRPILDTLEHVYFAQPAVPSPEGVRRPDYAFFPSADARQEAESHKGQLEFFKTALAVGDAKAWERSLDKRVKGPGDPFTNHNPSYQIDFYLRATDRRWGLLTNGRFWRLYHRDLSYRLDVYYEVDLPQIVTLDEDAFLYFLAFFHKEAFQPDGSGECFLDHAYRASTEYTAKVSQELKDNVYEALRLLAEGFLAFPGNSLKPQDLDLVRENAFIVIYRLLFVLYAEAREFLPVANPTYWGTYSLRALAREIATKEPFETSLSPVTTGYWSRLRDLFALINSGDDFLRIPPYNGRLFDDQKEHQCLAIWRTGDRYLAAAIDQLSRARAAGRTGRGFVSYKDLSIRELGSIYEGLLEHRPRYATQDVAVVKEDKRERFIPLAKLGNRKMLKTYRAGSVYLETDKGERKTTGSYYTPDYIVKYIVSNTLGPLLEEAKKSHGNLIDAILALKVLDPAMGSGHFLVEATDYLARALVEALGGDPRIMEEDEIRWARREVVERCIYGVDLNPLAVDLAKLSLWLSTVSLDKPLNFLDHHLRCGNSLIGARLEDLGQLPVPGKKKAVKAAPASQSLLEYYFHQNVATAVDHYFCIAAIPSDKLQDIQEKEKFYGVARDILKRYREVAHIWTSAYFGNEVPAEGYMSLQDKIRATDREWAELEKQPWFTNGVKIGEEVRRFFHWELEFPEVFFDRNGQRLQNPGFSGVVGNPPYVDSEEMVRSHTELRQYCTQRWKAASGNWDLFVVFIELGLRVSGFGGRSSLIVPNKLLGAEYCAEVQSLLKSNKVFTIRDYSKVKVFPDAAVYPIVYVVERIPEPAEHTIILGRMGESGQGEPAEIARTALKSKVIHALPEGYWWPILSSGIAVMAKAIDLSAPLGSYAKIAGASTVSEAYELTDLLLRAAQVPHGTRYFRFINTGTINRYEALWEIEPAQYNKAMYERPVVLEMSLEQLVPTRCAQARSAKLILAGMVKRLEGCIDASGIYLAGKSTVVVLDSSLNLHFLLSLVNSQLLAYIYQELFGALALQDGYLRVGPPQVEKLPIRRIKFTTPKTERERLVAEGKHLYYDGIKKAGLA
jgi:hypothetical protein